MVTYSWIKTSLRAVLILFTATFGLLAVVSALVVIVSWSYELPQLPEYFMVFLHMALLFAISWYSVLKLRQS